MNRSTEDPVRAGEIPGTLPPERFPTRANPLHTFYSLLFWSFIAVSSILLFPLALLIRVVTFPFDRRARVLHLFSCFWGSLYTWLNPIWRVHIEGRERIPSDRAVVFVANHNSLVDILVLFRLFRHFKWVSKIENFRIPIVGWNMSLNGYVKLKRGDKESAARMMETCERLLTGGESLMMFPEGTRSPDGRLGRFKPGAFELALRARKAIQPILIRGTHAALPKRGFVLQGRHAIGVTVLDPIPPESFAGLSAVELMQRVRTLMATALGEE